MLRKWFVPTLAVLAIGFLTPLDANAQLGKKGGGDEKGGGKTEPPAKGGGGKTQPPAKGGGGRTEPPSKGGGGQTQPPSRGGGSGGGRVEPPTKGGGGQTQPPSRGGGSGGGRVEPPTKGGGGQTQPPSRGGGSGGGRVEPPTKGGGGQTQPPSRGGGSGGGRVEPPTKGGGGQTQPPSRGGGSGGGRVEPPTKGGGGQTQPPSRGGGSGGGRVEPPTKGGGGRVEPPTKGGGGQTQPPSRGGGSGGGRVEPPTKGGGGRVEPPTRGGGQTGGGRVEPPTRGGGQTGGGRVEPPTRGGGQSGSGSFDRTNESARRTSEILRNQPFQKGQTSRSGNVQYGSVNNLSRLQSGSRPVRINSAPKVKGFGNSQNYDVYREDRTVRNSPFRSGYNHYNPHWVDNWFYYPHYSFFYNPGYCYPSPFYYYSHVPGYVASIRVIVGNFHFAFYANERYSWRRPSSNSYYNGYGNNYRYNVVDYQIDNLVTAFERGNAGYLDKMVPRDGFVQVALEDDADYRMRSDDFYDMLADIIEGTDTLEYKIREVRYGRNQYIVEAEHVYRDPWGDVERKFHTIVLEQDREGYEIAYFRVDRDRSW